ncbi:hypothetical protein AB0G83_30095 [Streptomyces klenkii]|uniref:hypothetical protein n=1 Tax=Streptomyces klenkii TaxID=1420899 RepID=UPI0033D06755
MNSVNRVVATAVISVLLAFGSLALAAPAQAQADASPAANASTYDFVDVVTWPFYTVFKGVRWVGCVAFYDDARCNEFVQS